MTAPILPLDIMNFTGLSREEISDRMRTCYKQVSPWWDDYSSNHPENLLLEGGALQHSLVVQVNDERIRQLSWALVTDRLAAQRMGRPSGFTLSGRSAASVPGYFQLPNGALASSKVLIPAGVRIMCDGIVHTVPSDMDIEVGSNTSAVGAVDASETVTETFQSDDGANLCIQLGRTPVVDIVSGSELSAFSVVAGNGTYLAYDATSLRLWTTFLEMGPSTLGFIPAKDNNGRVYLFFGNSIYGAVPRGAIQVTYRVGGGASNRVTAVPASWTVLDTVLNELENPVTVLYVNTAAASVAADEMTVDVARIRGPMHARAMGPCVNEDQFETTALAVSGIARAAYMTSNHDASIQEDCGTLYAVAYGGAYASGYYPPATPTASQLIEIETAIAQEGPHPSLMGVVTTVRAATLYAVNIAVRVYKAANYTPTQVKANITTALQNFFAVADDKMVPNTLVDFGYKLLNADGDPSYELSWDAVFDAIKNAAGVRKIPPTDNNLLLNGSRNDIYLQPAYFPSLGSISIYDMDTGGTLL